MYYKTIKLFTLVFFISAKIFAVQHMQLKENFNNPRFANAAVNFYNQGSTKFSRSVNTEFEWSAYAPTNSSNWGPIGFLYSSTNGHHRNSLAFINDSETAGSYAYCQFDSSTKVSKNDSLVGISKVTIDIQDDAPQDLVGLLIRDANNNWYYSKSTHGIFAAGSQIVFNNVDTYAWMKVKQAISNNLNTHTSLSNGLGDIRTDATSGTPNLSYITGGGIILHQAVNNTLNLRIGAITWEGKASSPSSDYFVNFTDLKNKQVASTPYLKWTNFGPGMSGYCDEFFVHPTDPNTMHMSLDMGNAYYTHDNGLSWITTKDWDSHGEMYRPTAMDFSRQNPDFGYAIDEKGNLLKTTDRGTTFTKTHSFGKKHSVITVDPNNENNWYVGAGQYWRVKFIQRHINALHGDEQYRNTYYGYIYISKDKGKTWTKITDNFNEKLDVAKIFVNPNNSKHVYAYTNYGFYKSTNGGYNWTKKGDGLPYNQPRDGDYYYNEKTGEFILYLLEQTHYADDKNGSVKTSGGVYKSTNGGNTWKSITGNLAYDFSEISDYGPYKTLYYDALAFWFNTSVASVKSKYPKMPKSIYSVFNRIAVSKTDPNVVFLSNNVKHDKSFLPGDIWCTKDGGDNWIACGRNGKYWVNNTDKAYWKSRNNPLGMNMKYAHLNHEMTTGDIKAGTRMLVAKPDGDIICIHEQQTLRTRDNGDSWVQVDDDETSEGSHYWVGRGGSNLPGENIIVDTNMDRYLFCSGEHGLWISAPDGNKVKPNGVAVEQITGQRIKSYDATSISCAAVHPNDSNKIYVMMFRQFERGQLRRSSDGGKTWKNISYPVKSNTPLSPEANKIMQNDLMFDSERTNVMYFCVPRSRWVSYTPTTTERNGPSDFNDFGVYRSKDVGFNWELVNNGLPSNGSVARIAMHPTNTKVLYAALDKITYTTAVNGGLYRTTNGGNNWYKVSIPSSIEGVNHVHIDKNNMNIYIAAGDYSCGSNKGGVWVSKDEGTTWTKIFNMPFVKECYSSDVNPNVLVVNVGKSKSIGNRNPGVYFSKDAGQNWTKANYQLGQPSRIRSIKPDPKDENVIWAALKGSGFYKGIIKEGVRANAFNVFVLGNEEVSLDASDSKGDTLSFLWEAPDGIQLSSYSGSSVTFKAPTVVEETEYKVKVTVSNGISSDVTVARVVVRPSADSDIPSDITEVKVNYNLYPNPVKDLLYISNVPEEAKISIYTMNGNLVKQQKLYTNSIDLSSISAGVYLYVIDSMQTRFSGKIIKE